MGELPGPYFLSGLCSENTIHRHALLLPWPWSSQEPTTAQKSYHSVAYWHPAWKQCLLKLMSSAYLSAQPHLCWVWGALRWHSREMKKEYWCLASKVCWIIHWPLSPISQTCKSRALRGKGALIMLADNQCCKTALTQAQYSCKQRSPLTVGYLVTSSPLGNSGWQ